MLPNIFIIGSWFAVFSCFSIAVLGTSATTITTTSAIILWFSSSKYTEYSVIIKDHPFTLISALLFIYIGISLIWSDHLSEGFVIWKKYREFILLPIFLTYFTHDKFSRYGKLALYLGMLSTLFISYLVYFDLFPSHPRQHRLDNDIFNSILISFFAYWSLLLATEHKKYRLFFIIIFIASFFCIFVIRQGRTGYLVYTALSLLFIFQTWKKKGFIFLLIVFIPTLFVTGYKLIPRIETTNLNLDYLAQNNIRFETYLNTIQILLENYFLGVGTGDFSSSYLTVASTHKSYWPPTVNPHSEFLMIFTQTGVIGLFLFILFFIYLFKASSKFTTTQSKLAIASTLTIAISCLFNSSFLDNSDGTLFMLLISLFFAQPKQSYSTS